MSISRNEDLGAFTSNVHCNVARVEKRLSQNKYLNTILSHYKWNRFNCVRGSTSSKLSAACENPDKSGVFSKRVMLKICRIL